MVNEALASRDVQTTVSYHEPQDQIPYYYTGHTPPAGVPATNAVNDPRSIIIHDMRGIQPDAFDLDVCGFKWATYPSAEKEFINKERVKTVYYAEMENILKKQTGGKRVFIYNHIIKRTNSVMHTAVRDSDFSHVVHADHTFEYAAQKVKQYLPDDAERLLKGRYQLINIWRPIANTVAQCPFGFVDYRTVDIDLDCVLGRLIFPRVEGGMFVVKYNPKHEWYYLSDQDPDEVLIFKSFDSDPGKAKLAPHSALPDLTTLADAPQTQSIEVAALVFDME